MLKVDSQITGRCIWITGASSGLGRALAEQLAQAGNFVIASARSTEALDNLVMTYPGKIKALPVDVSSSIDATKLVNGLSEITDYLDMVICAAGVCEYEDNLNFDPDMYSRAMDVNFLGVVRIFNVALPLLKKAQYKPHFVAVSSLSSCLGLPRAEAYGSSKAALNYFMQSLRSDMSKVQLDLSVVRPGFINTKLVKQNDFPMPFMMTAEQAATKVIAGLSTRKFFIDFPLRLSVPLHLFSIFFNTWCRWLAPKITRIHHW
ncbi:MAG: SDR family NAD(P)-dependent oxidoreductase [Moraxellaceae bacterium]|nr:MAG: SDR family NAD(P)-dependent oxidoreductase [Moraxellaceae bacterium]